MNIAILGTNYSCLIFFLLNSKRETIFILNEGLNLNGIQNKNVVKVREGNRLKIKLLIKYYIGRIKLLFNILKLRKQNLEIYATDYMPEALYFSKNKIHLIEDGTANYMGPKKIKISLKDKIIKRILLKKYDENYIPFGYEKNIEKIYLTGLAPIPNEIAHKVEIINLKNLWNKKTLKEQNEILDIFSFDLNIKDMIKGKEIILFTQPLSEDSIISEEAKINIYKEIIEKYPKEKLIIKTHPREKTNYKEIFKDYLVLENPFPFEIFNLLDVKFKKAVTLFSTAALGLDKEVEVDFYGTEVHPNIFSAFGNHDHIMKRNKFLDDNIK